MTLKAMYNNIADRYSVANRFGSISESHQCAIEQIKSAHLGYNQSKFRVLDLGVGNGAFLQALKEHLPNASFTGIDLSTEMLALAQRALRLKAIEANATEASHFLPHHSQDLVLAHFINAYIPINHLFNQAKILTRANGHFSFLTSEKMGNINTSKSW